jgi:hypothetical protein
MMARGCHCRIAKEGRLKPNDRSISKINAGRNQQRCAHDIGGIGHSCSGEMYVANTVAVALGGALLWAIAVEGKRFIAGFIEQPLSGAFQNHLPYLPNSMHLALGSVYIGLLTGITEPVVTLAAGLLWRPLAYDARRAVGIGLGAGAFEALYFGLLAIVASGNMIGSQAGFGVSVLIPVAERIILIPCHTVVRVMTLYAIATRCWSWFWGGFAIFTAMDSIAGFYQLTNHKMNSWLIELCFLPFSVISVVLLRYL